MITGCGRSTAQIIQPTPDFGSGVDVHFINGVARASEKLVVLLDLDKVVGDDESAALDSEN